MTQIAVRVTSQAVANQLASLVHTHNMRSVDYVNHKGQYKPFRVGATAIFWLYSSNIHYNQFTSMAYDSTLEGVEPHEYQSASVLAQELSKLV